MEGKIVITSKTKDGLDFITASPKPRAFRPGMKEKKGFKIPRKLIIRYLTKDDAEAMWEYINVLSKEQTFITFQGEQISLEDETKYLIGQLENIKNQKSVQLLVFIEKKMVGVSGIEMKAKIEGHVGKFGISIAKEFRGQGIGKMLMEAVLNEAKANLPALKIVELDVFANNPLAIQLYEKLGFQKFGELPEGVLHRGEYVGHIYMYKRVR
ncbi:MAG: GNAT family protein [Candidatus Daviesbacteria bacterium]|nr:GNAT family protein [Candidatus Daviesbacteria bacterium]